jgi:hypothetical protein
MMSFSTVFRSVEPIAVRWSIRDGDNDRIVCARSDELPRRQLAKDAG